MKIQRPRGTNDYLETEFSSRRKLEDEFVNFFSEQKGYIGIETPIFEQRNLFVRSVGDETDIVQKELFDLAKKSEEEYSLRPELTAPIIRSLIESGALKSRPKPINVFALGPCFRYERPQKGRRRQFNQLDLETIGKAEPELDANFIIDVIEFLNKIGITKLALNINSFGSQESKEKYSSQVKSFLMKNSGDLCETCESRLSRSPLRVLDCKNEACRAIVKNIPKIELTDEESNYFSRVLDILNSSGPKINKTKIIIDPTIVRGLDYYTGIIFEMNVGEDESRLSSIGGGGRYDKLIEKLGGPPLAAMGIGLGFERIIENLKEN